MVRKRNQHGSMRVLSRKTGDVFEYRYYRIRADYCDWRVKVSFLPIQSETVSVECGVFGFQKSPQRWLRVE